MIQKYKIKNKKTLISELLSIRIFQMHPIQKEQSHILQGPWDLTF